MERRQRKREREENKKTDNTERDRERILRGFLKSGESWGEKKERGLGGGESDEKGDPYVW